MAALVGSGCGARAVQGSDAEGIAGSGSVASEAGLGSSDARSGSSNDFMRGVDAEAYCLVPPIDAGKNGLGHKKKKPKQIN